MSEEYSGDYYDERYSCYFEPIRCHIYTLRSSKKKRGHKRWYCRIRRINGSYYTKSLRTTSKDIAERKTQEIWYDMIQAERSGNQFRGSNCGGLFDKWLEDVKKTWTPQRFRKEESMVRRYLKPFFGLKLLCQIDEVVWDEWLEWRLEYWTEDRVIEARANGAKNIATTPSKSTLITERRTFKQWWNWCIRKKFCDHNPVFRLDYRSLVTRNEFIEGERKNAKSLEDSHWRSITERLKQELVVQKGRPKNREESFSRLKAYYFITWSKSALIRPGRELALATWSDLRIIETNRLSDEDSGEKYKIATLFVRNPKTGVRRNAIFPLGIATRHVMKWMKICKEHGLSIKSGYIFPHSLGDQNNPVNTHQIYYAFKTVLDKGYTWNSDLGPLPLYKTREGKRVRLWSYCRSHIITRRIVESRWPVARVATAAGCSVEILLKHYYKEISSLDNRDLYASTFRDKIRYSKEQREKDDELFEFLKSEA